LTRFIIGLSGSKKQYINDLEEEVKVLFLSLDAEANNKELLRPVCSRDFDRNQKCLVIISNQISIK